MLEAPPGSREDLVEAARTPCTPCTPSELDTMLYGYTNSIYVLDHTPESLPDMDMLQLFASPAGRALVGGSSREDRRSQHHQQRTSTSTSSLSGAGSSCGSSSNSSSSATAGRTKRVLATASGSGSSSSRRGTTASSTGSVSAPTSPPARQRKSSTELYKEAVEILGLTCTLSDSCRCIDCQSNYFDYDDECGEARTELAAGTPILLDHALTHPLACSIQ